VVAVVIQAAIKSESVSQPIDGVGWPDGLSDDRTLHSHDITVSRYKQHKNKTLAGGGKKRKAKPEDSRRRAIR